MSGDRIEAALKAAGRVLESGRDLNTAWWPELAPLRAAERQRVRQTAARYWAATVAEHARASQLVRVYAWRGEGFGCGAIHKPGLWLFWLGFWWVRWSRQPLPREA